MGKVIKGNIGGMKRISFSRARCGFTFVEMLVILLVMFLLVAILLPALANARAKSARIACTNNLKQLGLAFRTFAVDNADAFPMASATNQNVLKMLANGGNAYRFFLSMSNELGSPYLLHCPFDKTRTAATNWAALRDSSMSYFVSLDATETEPQMILSGDSNLTTNGVPVKPGIVLLTTNIALGWTAERHGPGGNGNIVLGDGSVQQFSSARFGRYSATTNRLLIP